MAAETPRPDASWAHHVRCSDGGAGLVTGCDSVNGSVNCFQNVDTINKNLDKISDKTDDGKVKKAVDNLSKAIKDYNKAILNGDTNPDSSKIKAAADDLTNVCTP